MNTTAAETMFLDFLDTYAKLIPNKAHVVHKENRAEWLRRELAWMSYVDLHEIIDKFVKSMTTLEAVVNAASEGQIRPDWIDGIRAVMDDFTTVMDIVYDNLESRLH